MEITNRYTLENWRTRDIELHDIPDDVMTLPFEEVLLKAFGEIASLDLNPVELLFYCIFTQDDWRVVRTPLSRSRPVPRYQAAGIQQVTGIRDALHGSGVPDFFLWTAEGDHRFVEVKASEDGLNPNQRAWAEEHDCTFFIAQLAHVSSELSDEEIMGRNRIT